MFSHDIASALLLTTVCRLLGTEETSCRSFGRGMLYHFCLIQDSYFCHLCHVFQDAPDIVTWWKVTWSTWTLLLQSHALIIDAVYVLALTCWNMWGIPWKWCSLDRSICCSKTWIFSQIFQHWWSLSRGASCPFQRHERSPLHHQRCRLLN